MLWVYGHYKYFNYFSPGIVFIRENLTSTDPGRSHALIRVKSGLIEIVLVQPSKHKTQTRHRFNVGPQ